MGRVARGACGAGSIGGGRAGTTRPIDPAPPPPSPARLDPALALTAAALLALFVVPKLLMHAAGYTADLDTGNYSNLAWAIGHGEGFGGSVLGRHHLGEHFSPVMVLFAPVYLVWANAYVLMVAQGAAVALAATLAQAWLGRRLESAGVTEARLGPGAGAWRFAAGAVLLVITVLHPSVTAAWRTQFQPIVLGMPMVVAALWLMHGRGDDDADEAASGGGWWRLKSPPRLVNGDDARSSTSVRRNVALGAIVVLLLSTRESAALSVAGLAVYAAVALRRWRLAAVLAVVAGGWVGVVMGVVMPHFRAGSDWRHAAYFGPGAMWLASDETSGKAFYLFVLVGGFGFLPLLGRRAIAATLGAVPGVCLNLSTARPSQFEFKNHYDGQVAGFLIVAAMWGVAALVPRLAGVGRSAERVGRRWPVGVVVGAAVLAVSIAVHDKAGAQTPFEYASKWWPTTQRRAMVAAARRADRDYADAPAVVAYGRLGPWMCHRPNYMALRTSTWDDIATVRLMPGEIIVLPGPASFDGDRVGWITRRIESDGRTAAVEKTPWVWVYRYPADAPPANTGYRLKYVEAGRRWASFPSPCGGGTDAQRQGEGD